jgi:hypothetical protein
MSPVARPPEGGAPPDDPWEAARGSAREDVATALAPRSRVCPACGHVEAGGGRTCAACGTDLVSRRPRRRWSWRLALAIAAGVVAAVAIGAVITAPNRREARSEAARARVQQAKLEAAERRRLSAAARPVHATAPRRRPGQDPLVYRRSLVQSAERLITRDAQARVRAGKLSGPVSATNCAVYPEISIRRAQEADPATKAGRYECIAYSQAVNLPPVNGARRHGYFGSLFWAVIDYRRGSLVWCQISPRAGEGGKTLASTVVPPECGDPENPGG